jgi:hypothetical protein
VVPVLVLALSLSLPRQAVPQHPLRQVSVVVLVVVAVFLVLESVQVAQLWAVLVRAARVLEQVVRLLRARLQAK